MHYSNMAERVRSQGRGHDTMLVHMTPHEVGGLQALAMAHGGSLTINPETGLPEAGWLGKLLPTILGAVGMAFGIPPIWMGALGAVGGTAVTGSLKQGLMAGLGAFGGASMAGAAGIGGAVGHVGSGLGLSGSQAAIMHPALAATAAPAAAAVVPAAGQSALGALVQAGAQPMQTLGTNALAQGAAQAAGSTVGAAGPGILGGFKQAATAGLSGPVGGTLAKVAVPLATMGAVGGISDAFSPKAKKGEKEINEYGYTGPYSMNRTQTMNPVLSGGDVYGAGPAGFDSSEKSWFGPAAYTDSSGKPWTPGEKTTPGGVAPGGLSSLGKQPPWWKSAAQQREEEQRRLERGFAIGGPVIAGDTQVAPMPAAQFDSTGQQFQPQQNQQQQFQPQQNQQQFQPQQPQSPYMQPSAYGQQNNPNGLGGIKGLPGLAGGGAINMAGGSFVMPARETAEFGNGSSNAGKELLARMGGRPIEGPGDGVSDSIAARIGGTQNARVARDEVHFSPEAVKRIGKGSVAKGTQQLYSMMRKAQNARKTAGRGQDTHLRRGLA